MVLTIIPSPPPHTPNLHQNPHHHLLHLLNQCTTKSHLKQIHAQVIRTISHLHPDNTLFIYSRILHFSASISLEYASNVLDNIQNPNSFCYNTILRAFAKSKTHKYNAVWLYKRMVEDNDVFEDKHTFPFVLKACAFLLCLFEGRQVHARVVKLGIENDTYVSNSLIHFYAACGHLGFSRKVFDKMSLKSLVSWNVMIDGYVQFGEFGAGLTMFKDVLEVFEPDGFTMQSVVKACGGLGALSLGMWAHAYMLKRCDEKVKNDVLVSNTLVDMYCKCGSLDMAKQVFDRMGSRDVTCWNSMIMGFAMHGRFMDALDTFGNMCRMGVLTPNSITFIGVLTACNRGKLVNEGRKYFKSMVDHYKIKPEIEHYGCMVDLLARAGLIEEALNVVNDMHVKPDVVIWRSLLDACSKQNLDVEFSEEVARRVLETEGGVCSGVYVMLSRIYAYANRWDDVGSVRKLMGEKGIVKEPGCSSVDINGEAHHFVAGDTSHPRTKEIYRALSEIEDRLESVGYVPDLTQAPLVDESSDGKHNSLRLHSERLAIAFGLLTRMPGMPVRVFKNLRICNDCHTVTKLISQVYNVEIVVRDRVRFHHFRKGLCSCLDHW